MSGSGGEIKACWAKPRCGSIFLEIYNYVNADAYGPPPLQVLNYVHFGKLDIYTMTRWLILPVFTAFDGVAARVYLSAIKFSAVRIFSSYM
jgi:hypothetical protein